MVTGAQLYTLRDYCQNEKDLERSLERVAEMGYTTVQISGVAALPAKKIRELCDKFSLKIVLTHINADRLLYDTDNVIADHDEMGCDYVGIGGMPGKYPTPFWIDMFYEDFRPAAEKLAAKGKLFMYHNHSFEFQKFGSKLVMDILAEKFPPELMGFTLDTYWVQAGGADICLWIEKLSGRLPTVHLKDMAMRGDKQIMAPVGEGNIYFEKVCKAFEKAGTKYMLVEQDFSEGSPFDALESSYNNLKKLGYK